MLAIAPGWEVEVERGPGWLLVKLRNPEFDAASEAPPLAEQLWSLLERHFVYRLVLDFHDVSLLHSCLLGQLILLDKQVRDHHGVVRLCGLSRGNQEVLHVHGLDSRFPAYASPKEAVMGCGRKPR
ncbi:MAG: STAS domain-containing protein [Planctomycetota bacterium]|jgi:anti-anti-sigma factor